MTATTYTKPPRSIPDQIALLQQRNLHIADVSVAEHYLAYIGYYRLSAYWLPFELPGQTASRNHQFQPGTNFDAIVALYAFDRELRLLVMEAIERIEVALRSQWVNTLALASGNAHCYLDASLFKDPWQHLSDIAKVARDLADSKETFVTHYRNQYNQPFMPPVWAMAETLSLGALSRWYKATKDNKVKMAVARAFSMPTVEIMEGVLHELTYIRNLCAHHSRLWNRKMTLQLPNIKKLKAYMQQEPSLDGNGQPKLKADGTVAMQLKREIYNYLLVMLVMMQKTSPDSSWQQRLATHINKATTAQQQAMGFPANWQTLAIWQGGRV